MSRRLYALALVLVCSLQSTDAASASTLSVPTVQPLLVALQSTWVFAAITGQSGRLAAQQAPPPTFPTLHNIGVRPNVNQSPSASVTMRLGTMIDLASKMGLHPLTRRDARPDPLVMGAAAASSSARRGGTMSVRSVARLRTARANTGATLRAMTTYTSATTPTTGVDAWWTYAEKPIPGVGNAMVNVANGNLVLQADDVDVPERGIDLTFHRTYNSQSAHDASNTDGTSPSVFGNGWTNTYDVHIVHDTTNNVISVFDVDGARYDYTANTPGICAQTPTLCWLAPAGMQGTTLYTSGSCAYGWTKKNGTTYTFYSPDVACDANLTANAGYAGRIYQITGRNINNSIGFVYWWQTPNGVVNDSSLEYISTISVVHSDGQRLLLNFGTSSCGNTDTELTSITRPDNLSITYCYDSNDNLVSVKRPGNATDDATQTQSITSLTEEYWYYVGTHEMQWIAGPRYMAASVNNGNTSSDGSTYDITYDAISTAGRVTWLSDYGLINFAPNDGTSAPLQAGSTGLNVSLPWRQSEFVYLAGGETQLTDTQGHATRWWTNSSGNATQISEYTGNGYSWLVANAAWDGHYNITSTTDPRGNTTNYAYDANGNVVAIALPQVATSAGPIYPTSTFTYDLNNNNLLSFCDPVYNQSNNWSNPASAPPVCPTSGTGAFSAFVWNTGDTNEPYGVLTDIYTPLGYHRHVTYDSNDYGLPVVVQAAAAIHQLDGSTRQPTEEFAYDSLGNVVCSANYIDPSGALHWSRYSYDTMNRQKAVADADDSTPSMNMSQCPNSGTPGSHIVTTTTYNVDGTVASTQTPSEYAAGVSTSHVYDADGNEISETSHFGCTSTTITYLGQNNPPYCKPGTKNSWYDGEDRLVEVQEATNMPQDLYPWITRYLYDLSANSTNSLQSGPSYASHGGLFKTQRYIPGTLVTTCSQTCPGYSTTYFASGPPTWTDVSGTAYDALDRATSKYTYLPNSNTVETESLAYDGTGQLGLLASDTTPVGDVKSYTYDVLDRITGVAYQTGSYSQYTAPRNYTYDPDGRVASVGSVNFGTWNYLYYADGTLKSVAEPTSGGGGNPGLTYLEPGVMSDAVTYLYANYLDGMPETMQATGSGTNFNRSMSYRSDGAIQTATYSVAGGSVGYNYTPAGRLVSKSDPMSTTTTGYDSYGRMLSRTLPGSSSTYNSFTYDDEGEPVFYVNPFGVTYVGYTSTGEQVGGATLAWAYVDGVPIQAATGSCSPVVKTQCIGFSPAIDTRDLVVSGQYESGSADPNPPAVSGFPFDANGRQLAGFLTTNTYDADNHTVEYTASSGISTWFAWGPNGHPVTTSQNVCAFGFTSCLEYHAFHWEGGNLSFTSPWNGAPDNYKVATDGDWVGGSVWYYDRDLSGKIIQERSGSSYVSDSFHIGMYPGCYQVTQPAGCVGPTFSTSAGPLFTYDHSDGITDGIMTVQGARALSVGASQWTTPDAAAGSIEDPMSQARYTWNNNNAFEYSDPSGFSPGCSNGTQDDDGVQTTAGDSSGEDTCIAYMNHAPPSSDQSDKQIYGSWGDFDPSLAQFDLGAGGSFGRQQLAPFFHCSKTPCMFSAPSKECKEAQEQLEITGESIADLVNGMSGKVSDMDSSYSNPRASSRIAQVEADGLQGGGSLIDVITFYVNLARATSVMKLQSAAAKQVGLKCNIAIP